MNPITLDQASTICRTLGHGWVFLKPGKDQLLRRYQCYKCTTIRTDRESQTGEIIRRTYKYPKGYKRSRIPRPELRVQLRAALKVWGSEEEMELW